MLIPRLDLIDLNYTTLYRIADYVVFHVHVPRTPAAETVGRHFDSSFIIFPDYNIVVDRKRQDAFHLSKETGPFTTSASATYSNSDDAAAVTFCTLENQLIAPTPSITAPSETECRVPGQVAKSASKHADSFVYDSGVPP